MSIKVSEISIYFPDPQPDETEPYCLFGEARARPGRGDALAERLVSLVAPTRAESGMIAYHVHRDRNDGDLFRFYEAWASREHLYDHLGQPYIQRFLAERFEYLAEDLQLQFARMISAVG